MYNHRSERERVDVVDLDPYGTAAPFIDGAVQCVKDGGMSADHTERPLDSSDYYLRRLQAYSVSHAPIFRSWLVPIIQKSGELLSKVILNAEIDQAGQFFELRWCSCES